MTTSSSASPPQTPEGSRSRRQLNRSERLLNRIKQRPSLVLKDKRCHKPEFAQKFFDYCIDRALQSPKAGVELAKIALELAKKIGDTHLMHHAEGVRVHAYIATTEWDQAGEYLEDYRASALTCCEACAGDWYIRQGDLLVERRDPKAASVAIAQSIDKLGCASGDKFGRICFIRGLEGFYRGAPGPALDDVGITLREVDLESPRGYFMDALAFLSCFLQRLVERYHDEQALEIAEAFKMRLQGLEHWTEVRTRLAWVEGQLHARLRHWRRADRRFEKARNSLTRQGPDRHALAAAIDHCLLYTHRPCDDSRRRILSILGSCERRLKQLDPDLKKQLKLAKSTISNRPRDTAMALLWLRRSFIVPVAAIVPGFTPR